MKKVWILLLALTALFNSAYATTCAENPVYCNWVVYYSNQASSSEFADFEPIVLDADFHPDLVPLNAMGKTLLGYVSLGEVGTYRYYFDDVENAGILIAENPNWPGSWYVDIRSSFWTNLIINTVIPNVLAQGFDGIFMDSLDIPIYLEQVNPAGFAGMTQAAIDLVIAIRTAYPNIPLMLNRAYQILNDLGGVVNYALGESVYTTFDFSTQTYDYTSPSDYAWSLDYLQGAQATYPNLIVMSLDYWDSTDPITIRKIYKKERNNGFRPYVSTIFLNEIIPEP